MSIQDVRDYLLKQMAELADSDATAKQQALVVERARASAQVAGVYVDAVKTEIYAARLLADTGYMPAGVEAPRHERIPFDGKPK